VTVAAAPLPREFAPIAEQFWPRVRKADIGKRCWYLKIASRGPEPSYSASNRPRINIGSVNIAAVAVAWELTGKGDTTGTALVNSCGDESCINPDHFYRRDYSNGSRGRGLAETIKQGMGSSYAYSRGTIPTDADKQGAVLLALLGESGVTLERALKCPWGTYIGSDVCDLAMQAERDRPK
jgi:hypothetical protein